MSHSGVVHIPHPYHGIEHGWDSTDKALADVEEIVQLEAPQTIADHRVRAARSIRHHRPRAGHHRPRSRGLRGTS